MESTLPITEDQVSRDGMIEAIEMSGWLSNPAQLEELTDEEITAIYDVLVAHYERNRDY